jgi:hypothetical protein
MFPPQECHLKHPVPMKGAVFPAAIAILLAAFAGQKAAANDDSGLGGQAVSAVLAPVVHGTVPFFSGLAASTDPGHSPDIRARVTRCFGPKIRAKAPWSKRAKHESDPQPCTIDLVVG